MNGIRVWRCRTGADGRFASAISERTGRLLFQTKSAGAVHQDAGVQVLDQHSAAGAGVWDMIDIHEIAARRTLHPHEQTLSKDVECNVPSISGPPGRPQQGFSSPAIDILRASTHNLPRRPQTIDMSWLWCLNCGNKRARVARCSVQPLISRTGEPLMAAQRITERDTRGGFVVPKGATQAKASRLSELSFRRE